MWQRDWPLSSLLIAIKEFHCLIVGVVDNLHKAVDIAVALVEILKAQWVLHWLSDGSHEVSFKVTAELCQTAQEIITYVEA